MNEETDRRWLRIGSILAAIGVAAGAFGAHALAEHPRIETWKTGALYLLLHAIALCVPGMPLVARRLLLVGILVFSGSLFALVLTGQAWLGAVTPLGGVSFILGWVMAGLRRS